MRLTEVGEGGFGRVKELMAMGGVRVGQSLQ